MDEGVGCAVDEGVEDVPICGVDGLDVPMDGDGVSVIGEDADGMEVVMSPVPMGPVRPPLRPLPLPLPLPPTVLSAICMHKMLQISIT